MRSPLVIIAQTIRAILLASAMAATLVGRRANNWLLRIVGRLNSNHIDGTLVPLEEPSTASEPDIHSFLPNRVATCLDCRNGATIDDVFRAGDCAGTRRSKKSDELRYLGWLRWPP